MATDGAPDPKNGVVSLLSTLAASGDNWVKLGIMAMIAISGGGNFIQTKESAKSTDREIGQAIREVHELHDHIKESIQRQKEIREMLEKLTKDKKE